MKNLYKIILCAFFGVNTLTQSLIAQQTYVNRTWENSTGLVGAIHRTALAVDNDNNLIVVCNTLNTNNNTDVLITKYDPDGAQLWQQTYNGSANGNDYAIKLKTNSSNEIFVAAVIEETSGEDFGVLKFSSNGDLLWANSWNGSANGTDIPSDIGIDENDDVYLVGGSETSNGTSDYAIVKFDASGSFVWETNYDYVGLHDAATYWHKSQFQ